jgi:hypothetical protein
MSLDTYRYAQQGTLWIISQSGTPEADVVVTLAVNGTTEVNSPFNIRSAVIASQDDDVYSFAYIFPCNNQGEDQSSIAGTSIPFTQFTMDYQSIQATMSFSNGAASGNVAGFGVRYCVWSTKTSLDQNSTIPMLLTFGALNSYYARFAFQTAAKGMTFDNAFNMTAGHNLVPWGTGQDTLTGLPPATPPSPSNKL